jgi:hypothetical protein
MSLHRVGGLLRRESGEDLVEGASDPAGGVHTSRVCRTYGADARETGATPECAIGIGPWLMF